MKKVGIGVCIDHTYVDVVVVEKKKDGFSILKSARQDLSGVENFSIESEDWKRSVADALNVVFKKANVKPKGIVLNLPGGLAMVRRFKMPFVSSSQRAEAIKYEAQKYIPFKIDEIVSEGKALFTSKDKTYMEVLFVGANRSEVERYLELFSKEGIKIELLEIIPLSLSRVLRICKLIEPDDNAAVVYLSSEKAGFILIIKDCNPFFIRYLEFRESFGPFTELLLRDLKISLDYYKRETKIPVVNKIIICGWENLLHTDKKEELRKKLEAIYPGSVFDVNISDLKRHIGNIDQSTIRYIAALGQALAFFEEKAELINLIPPRKVAGISAADAISYRPILVEVVSFVFALLLLQAGMTYYYKNYIQQNRRSISQTLQHIKISAVPPDAGLSEVRSAALRLRKKHNFLVHLVGSKRKFFTKVLNHLGSVILPEAWIEELFYIDQIQGRRIMRLNGLLSSGDVNEPTLAGELLERMKKDEVFSNFFTTIKMGSFRRVKAYSRELLSFELMCESPES